MTYRLVAKSLFGMEEVLAEEIRSKGFGEIQRVNRAVLFETDRKGLYIANASLRNALKILVHLYDFEAFTEHELYKGIQQYQWTDLLNPSRTFAIEAVVNSEFFNHSNYVALKTKDAIVDQIRDRLGSRPNVDTRDPDLRIHVNISQQKVSVSIDSSGEPLFKRGYRQSGGIAPLNEVLAAGMIDLTGWDGTIPFYDGMCGSGTLLAEAGLKGLNRAPNTGRKDFAFMKWEDFDRKLWEEVKNELKAKENSTMAPIIGADISNSAVSVARLNIEAAGLSTHIEVERKAFRKFVPREEHKSGVVILNPPYGERIETGDTIELYKSIGDQFKQHFAGFNAWVISSDPEAIKFIGLRPEKRIALYNGQLACKFHKFTVYEGTKKLHRKQENN